MKLYIDNMNMKMIDICELTKYIIQKIHMVELYSEDGIYIIENGTHMRKLNIHDGKVHKKKNYISSINIVIDESIIKKDKVVVSHIPNKYTERQYERILYRLRERSPLRLVIEHVQNVVCNCYFQLVEKHAAYSEADIESILIKEDIEEFNDLMKYKGNT